ncbi:uncharacterized protein [Typha angustifolia]|uniref:uncharacterized protein isoform X2 n=1 Tax=Typha angustifolia TaxID=59011 RepID=UPI003C2CDB9C
MGPHEGWTLPGGPIPNGLLPNEVGSLTRVLDEERWEMAEGRIAELISRIQPNQPSEERRKAVANYVQRLILKCFSCEVFTFGSVPLKTYLPDGDIDLTAFSNNNDLKDTWANEVRDALQNEEKNENAEFHVKEVQYIQAEVKIIKCLVENIVVDISFNQVGGLCTLCFLEEMDSLINQNHLFKRSIILIKAWCYYESRILGAHHGLISTYALETLVLYIFHVFNNQLSGPLEVLYRFLEFFSNFDWENFCVSLWGPVTISSLPHMIAVPPRRDGGDVLLSKPFLDACSSVYAVTPGALENQGQPFVLKHFNVIDPLRTNNNLGRSVSKGNFFRIRSAFTFGAKRLARLLECAKEDVIDEVNQFFMNTWERHGSGNRPDAPVPNFLYVQPQKNVPVEELKNFRATASIKKKNVNHLLHVDHEKLAEGVGDYCHSTSQAPDKLSRHPQDLCRASSPSVNCTHSQKLYGMQINSSVSDQLERSNSSSGSVKSERGQRTSNSNHSVNDSNGKNRSQFVRTQSSPELRDSSGDVLSHIRRNKVVEATKYSKFDYSSKRKNLGSVVLGSQSTKASLDDPMSTTSSNPSLKAASDTNSVSNSYQDDLGFASMREELASVSEALEMQHEMIEEEQDLVNLMASANLHNFNGQVKLPIHMASHDLPVSNLIGSVSHAHRNLAGILPSNMPLIGPPWASSIPFSQGFLSPPMIHYFHTVGPSSDRDGKVESIDENSSANEPYQEEGDHFQEHDAVLAKGYNSGEENHLIHNFDGKQQSYSSGLSFASLTGDNNSGALGEPKFGSEDGESVRGDYSDIFQNQASGGTYDKCNTTSPNLRLSPVTQASSLRRKSSYQSSRNGSTGKISRSSREKWGKKPAKLSDPTSLYGKSRRQPECTSEHISAEDDDDTRDCVSISTMGSDMPDRVAGSASVASAHLRRHHVPDYEPAHISGSDSMIPIAPDHLNSSRQRVVDNSGVAPITFVPTGPPVPFFVLPFGNFASDTGNSDGSASQFDRNARLHHHSVNLADHNFDLFDNLDHPDIRSSSTASRTGASESSDEYKSDILNGDLARHRHSLLYGRFCQNTHYHGPFTIMVQPTFLQDQIPLDSPGRPLSGNVNLTQVMGHGQRLVPMMPLQPGSERASGVIQQYGEDAPRYRVGTGTYLPNPVQSSMRNYRGNFNGNRSDRGDKEGNWTNPKQRVTGRSHGRNQADRPNNLRPNRLTGAENQADKQWQSYRNEPHRREPRASYPVQYSSFGPISSTHSPVNNSYGMYPPAPTSSNGVGPPGPAGPPVIMVYPFDQDLKDVRRPDGEILFNGVYEQRYGSYQGGSSRSSPDQPSSPRIRRYY